MRLLILTARPAVAANRRLVEAASELALAVEVVDAIPCTATVASDGSGVNGIVGGVTASDVVVPRIGNWRPETLLAVLETMVASGARSANTPAAIRCGRDHWQTIRVLGDAGLPVPATVAGAEPEILAAAAVEGFGLPVVVKQRRSRMGVGVVLCRTRDHLEAVLDSLWRLGDEVIVQRWLTGGEHTDRLLVAGGRVVAAARFTAGEGEWRSNAARGGSASSYDPTSDEITLAIKAAEAVDLGQCGVDLVMSDRRPVVIEVNPTPGFLRLEKATGVDVARALIEDAISR